MATKTIKRTLGTYSIELDCAPGATRPNDLLPGVLDGTDLTVEDFENTSRSFGNWEFTVFADKENLYKAVQPLIQKRVTALYTRGAIRYGSW